MVLLVLFGGFIIAALVALVITPRLRDQAISRYWIDHVEEDRKIHDQPIPRIGGMGIAAGIGAGLVFFLVTDTLLPGIDLTAGLVYPCLGGLLIFLAGLYDDLHGMGFKRKFFVQLVVAYFMLLAGYSFDVSGLPLLEYTPRGQMLITFPLTMLWIVGMINAVNLIDGLDGLAGGISVISLVALCALFGIEGGMQVVPLAVIVCGGVVGFLFYNRNPASIFMGDSGSMVLGFFIAIAALQGTAHGDPWLALVVPMVAVGVPITDTTLTIARRFVAGRSPFSPDADHIHHRLFRRFQNVKMAVYILYAAACFLGAGAFLAGSLDRIGSLVVLAFMGAILWIGLRYLGYLNLLTVSQHLSYRLQRKLAKRRVKVRQRRESAKSFIEAHTEKQYAQGDMANGVERVHPPQHVDA